MGMESLLGLLCTCMIVFLAATSSVEAAAREFKVGDDLGWHEPAGPNNTAFYSQWAAKNRFQVGDSLVFEYQNDSVLAVEKWDYFHCDPREPITSFDNGNTTFNLDRPGEFYFISGTVDHCQNGQNLIVDVMSPHPISIPPEGFSAMAPSPSHSSQVSASMVLGSATFVFVLLLLTP